MVSLTQITTCFGFLALGAVSTLAALTPGQYTITNDITDFTVRQIVGSTTSTLIGNPGSPNLPAVCVLLFFSVSVTNDTAT